MRTALDTNVISSIWSYEESAPALLMQLESTLAQGSLVICPVVYAELHGYPRMTREKLDEFLGETRISVDWQMDAEIWSLAGNRFAAYVRLRRRQKQPGPKRLLADFVIGAHAQLRADRLLTLDHKRFQHDFSELILE